MKKINEIFYSLQGEGMNTGVPAIFVRFSGCNLQCPFCDTRHEEGRMMTDEEIVAEIKKYPANLVVFTGGEPTIQLDYELCSKLKKAGKFIAVETNGTGDVPSNVDWTTLSPKFEFCDNAELCKTRKHWDELKVVFDHDTDMDQYDDINASYRFIQPCDTGDNALNKGITEAAVSYCKSHPQWRLSLQTQKITGIR